MSADLPPADSPPTNSPSAASQSPDQIKLLLDHLSQCWRQADAQGAAALFTENALYSEPPAHELQGRSTIAAFFHSFFSQHQSIEFAFHRILIGDGEAAAEWTFAYTRASDVRRQRRTGIAFIDTASGRIHVWRSFSARLE
jgi:uncharacterized protein (TIGR02246 family)